MLVPLLFFLLLLLLGGAEAMPIRKVDLLMGPYTLSVLHDEARPFPTRVMHVSTEGKTVYAVALEDGVSDQVVCRRVVTKQIIVNPRGCDSDSAAGAVVDHFCEFGGELALRSARERMRAQWTLRADSPQCEEKAACLGPVYATAESWTPDKVDLSDEDLLASRRGVFVVSGAGPAGEIPMTTPIPIRAPKLRVHAQGACAAYEGVEFEMNTRDNYAGAYVTNATYVFGSGIARRLRLERVKRGAYRVLLGVRGGSSSFYTDEFASVSTVSGVGAVVNVRMDFRSVSNETEECVGVEIVLAPAPRPFEMLEPEVPDDLTYYLDRRGAFQTSECSLVRGALDESNNLVFPDCPRNALCGGRVRFRAPGPFGQRYRVTPDAKYKDFEWSCVRFWPRSGEFQGYRGSGVIERDAPHLLACNAPFPFPKRIEDKDDDRFEKLRQCKMLGGRGALESVSYCTVDVVTTLCRRGWYYFDETCYYSPDPERDGRYKSRQDDADLVCASLHPKARAARGLDAYAESWLQSSFVFQTPSACGTDPVRALVTGSRCKCYDCSLNATTGGGSVTECSCETPQYPLCAYRVKDDYLAWNDEKFHPATLQILRDGQCMGNSDDDGVCMGNERYGRELECECLPGSAGQYCERRSRIVNASTLVGDGLLLKFAQACEQHGFSDEGELDACACLPGYGPESVFAEDPHNDHPCGLPSTSLHTGAAIIDGVRYETGASGVCNGAGAGEGVCIGELGGCKCVCRERANMDPDGEGPERAFDGLACSARVPKLPAGGFQINGGIVERMCNGRGTVCPSGERLGEKRLDGTYVVSVDSDACRNAPDGCVCDNGFSGTACTVPVPYDDAARDPTFVDGGAYVPIRGGRRPVMNVDVRPELAHAGVKPTCNATAVFVSDTTLRSESECARREEPGLWWCGGARGTHVTVRTSETHPSCAIRVYTENHSPCGNHTDPYAPRLFANEAFRDWNRTDEFQSLEYGRYGGTTTECSCDADHTGPLCANRISSKRPDVLGGAASNRVCGEETQPPRGRPGADGVGCECASVAGFDFAGSDACACASVNGQRCGGVCKCVSPSMPFGRCEFDALDEALDPMSSPFAAVAPPDAAGAYTYVVDEGTWGAVMEFEGESWLAEPGQTFRVEAVRGNVSICHDNSRYPLNVTHECGANAYVSDPVRAVANVTVRRYTCAEEEEGDCFTEDELATCDPAFSCPARLHCGPGVPYPCILHVHAWTPDPNEEGRVLASARYVNSRVTCADLMRPVASQEDVEFPYGVIPSCADPVMRWLDAALEGAGLVRTRQCRGGFGPHSNVKGQAYGVFDDVIPGLDFRSAHWTRDHYAFLAGVMNGGVCVSSTGEYVPDALTDAVMDEYVMDLVRGGAEETETELGEGGAPLGLHWNATSPTRDDPSAWWGNAYWHVGNAGPFGPSTRWGGWTFIPGSNGTLRKVTIRNGGNVTLTALSLVGPKGETCLTRLEPFRPNDTLTVDCGASFEPEPSPVSFRRLWDANLTHLGSAMSQAPAYVMLYSAREPVAYGTWLESDIAYTSRATTYAERWRALSGSIVGRRVWPQNGAFSRECARLGGTVRPVDLERDAQFLRRVHGTHLGPRRCTHDWQCKSFARDKDRHRCVPDDTGPALLWRNGDPKTQDPVVGDEGGCDCDGVPEIMDPQFHGSRCASGYEATWRSVLDYELEASKRVRALGIEYALVDPAQWEGHRKKSECTLPTSTSAGRPTDACGGARGRLVRSAWTSERNVTVYSTNKVKRCASVVLEDDGSEHPAAQGEAELDLHAFGTRVVVVEGRAFVDGEERDPGVLTCVEFAQSSTHRVLSRVGNATAVITTKPRDAWTSFLVELG